MAAAFRAPGWQARLLFFLPLGHFRVRYFEAIRHFAKKRTGRKVANCRRIRAVFLPAFDGRPPAQRPCAAFFPGRMRICRFPESRHPQPAGAVGKNFCVANGF
ncbi:MAG: hypothetical protein C6P35_01765 [Cohnella sp.]|nr:MAG: hypothetical protein C6P35_01765 [Cohnella sp.]